MSISFQCTGCGRTLKVADELAGRKAKCPQCQTVLYIPEGPAVAVTPAPAPAPARRRAAPAPARPPDLFAADRAQLEAAPAPAQPPTEEEYDDRADAGADRDEEPERRPRRKKKAKKSVLVPVLLAVGAVFVLLVLGGGGFAAWLLLSGGGNDDLLFMPDGTQMVGQVRADQILNSDALKQVYATFPEIKKQVDLASAQSTGVDQNNVERMYFGAAKLDFNDPKTPPSAVAVLHFKNAVKVEDFEAGMKKGMSNGAISITYNFTDTKVGRYTMTDVTMTMPTFNFPAGGKNAPPAAAPPPVPVFSFTMPDDKRLVMGTSAALKAVLTRDKKPDLGDKLQAAIKQTDWNATIAFAADYKGAFPQGSGASSSPVSMDKVDGLSVAVKVAADVDVNVTATCKDASAAGELSGSLKTVIANAKMQYASKAPPEIADLMDITPQVNGSNVSVAKTIKVAPLLKLAKGQSQALPFNPFRAFGGR